MRESSNTSLFFCLSQVTSIHIDRYICIYMHIYTYVYIYMYMYTSCLSHVIPCDRQDVYIYIYIYICINMQHTATHCNTLQHTATHSTTHFDYVYILPIARNCYIYRCTFLYICIYVHIYVYTYIHTYTHICILSSLSQVTHIYMYI